jgi:hypothetical protein
MCHPRCGGIDSLRVRCFKSSKNFRVPGDRILKSSILQLSYSTTIMLRTGCLQNRPHRSLKKYRTYRPVPRQCIRPRYDTTRPNRTTTTSEEKSALPEDIRLGLGLGPRQSRGTGRDESWVLETCLMIGRDSGSGSRRMDHPQLLLHRCFHPFDRRCSHILLWTDDFRT